MRKRVLSLIVVLLVAGQAAPAYAHGGPGTDATNYRSTLRAVVSAGPDGKPGGPAVVPGLTWKVLGGDVMLRVVNRSGQELRIPGYSGEPYLRIGPAGVLRNENSPATYLNQGRFGGEVPSGVSEKAKPRWAKVADEPEYAWHEHRLHWMSFTPPPKVLADPTKERVIFDWNVPFSLGGRQFLLPGQLKWIPPKQIWPWLLGALLWLSVPLLPAAAIKQSARRRMYLLRSAAAVVILLGALSVIHSIDDVTAIPAGVVQSISATAKVLIFVSLAVVGAVWGWRGDKTASIGLAAGAGALSLGMGVAHVFQVSNSLIATAFPVNLTRSFFAATLVVIVPAGVAAWVARFPAEQAAPDRSQVLGSPAASSSHGRP